MCLLVTKTLQAPNKKPEPAKKLSEDVQYSISPQRESDASDSESDSDLDDAEKKKDVPKYDSHPVAHPRFDNQWLMQVGSERGARESTREAAHTRP